MVFYSLLETVKEKEKLFHDITINLQVMSEELKKILKEVKELEKDLQMKLQNQRLISEKVNNLKTTLEKLREELKDTKTIEKIVVDKEYGLSNGLVDLNRYVLMKLTKIFSDDQKTRNIFGTCECFYYWSKQRLFHWARKKVLLPIRFVADKLGRGIIAIDGGRIKWVKKGLDWAILDEEICTGICAVTVNFRTGRSVYIGVISETLLNACRGDWLYRCVGQCCIGKYGFSHSIMGSGGRDFYDGYGDSLLPQSGEANVRLEVDAGRHTLSFFVNGKQLPHVVAKVPQAVYFAVCNNMENDVVTVTAFEKLHAPTVDRALRCSVYEWI